MVYLHILVYKQLFGDLWTNNQNSKYNPPAGIDSSAEIRQIQARLGVATDGVWGKETQNAWERMRGANTAATFTKTVIDKGKTGDRNYGNESLTRYHREKVEQIQQKVDWQLRKRPFGIRCADPFAAYGLGLVVPNATKNAGVVSLIAGTVGFCFWQWLTGGDLAKGWGILPVVFGCAISVIAFFLVNSIERKRGVAPAPSAYVN